jgi:hypothetical protein
MKGAGLSVKDSVEIVGTLVTMLATILAGAWAYYQFIRGRVLNPRITMKLSGTLLQRTNGTYVLCTVEMTNIGLGLTRITRKGTALSVVGCDLPTESDRNAVNLRQVVLATVSLFRAHGWLEPGCTVHEQHIIALPARSMVAVLLEGRVVAQGVSFTATSIVAVPDSPNRFISGPAEESRHASP